MERLHAQIDRWKAKHDRAVETRENANAVSVRVQLDRDKWTRLFNRLEAAVTHHRKGKLHGIDTSDEIDEALWAARDKILKDAGS